jgi:fructose-1,6-bisphosphatase/inositol monophosphatase family enzyme
MWIGRRGGALASASDGTQDGLEEEGEVEEEEEEEEVGLYVIVVDPMDSNGRRFCKQLQVCVETRKFIEFKS